MPAATPSSTPEADPMVATPVLILVQVPPDGVLESDVVAPTQTVGVPAIAVGNAFTVSTPVFLQPVDSVYVMTVVPAAIPVATPLPPLIVATAGVPDDHVPPVGEPDMVVVLPAQTAAPLTGEGSGLTVAVMVRKQPVGKVYVTVDVPVAIAANTPVVTSMVPTEVAELAQVPPVGVLLKVRVSPTQTAAVPLMAVGNGLTVNTAEREQPVESV